METHLDHIFTHTYTDTLLVRPKAGLYKHSALLFLTRWSLNLEITIDLADIDVD